MTADSPSKSAKKKANAEALKQLLYYNNGFFGNYDSSAIRKKRAEKDAQRKAAEDEKNRKLVLHDSELGSKAARVSIRRRGSRKREYHVHLGPGGKQGLPLALQSPAAPSPGLLLGSPMGSPMAMGSPMGYPAPPAYSPLAVPPAYSPPVLPPPAYYPPMQPYPVQIQQAQMMQQMQQIQQAQMMQQMQQMQQMPAQGIDDEAQKAQMAYGNGIVDPRWMWPYWQQPAAQYWPGNWLGFGRNLGY